MVNLRSFRLVLTAVAVVAAVLLASGPSRAAPEGSHRASTSAVAACSSGYVEAKLSWGDKCLRAGEFCKIGNPEYHAYGFDCPVSGHLTYSSSATNTDAAATTPPTPTAMTQAPTADSAGSKPTGARITLGQIVLLRHRTQTSDCVVGALPDRRCSPGAYYLGLTNAIICSAGFRTSSIRSVSQSEKHQVEVEYGLAPKGYGSTLEIDHIVSLELGGSNDIANLYPERAALANHAPGFRIKDRLENAVHRWVCEGKMSLRSAQEKIASNWVGLYQLVFGTPP